MNFQQQQESLSAVVAVPTTPFGPDGGIDEAAYQRVIRRLIEGGIRTVTPNGNTGEFYALAPAEAKAVTRLGLEAADPDTTVMVGVGHDVASAREAARDAQAAGAAMIMVHQPVHPYVSVDGWIEYHRAIASDVPELGVVLYVRNETIPGSAFARLGESCPNVIGVKYAVPHPARCGAFHLGRRPGRAPRPGVFRRRRHGIHFRTGERRSVDVASPLSCPGRSRPRRRDRDLAPSASLRGTTRRQRQREQRLGGERGALPTRDMCPGHKTTELIAVHRVAG